MHRTVVGIITCVFVFSAVVCVKADNKPITPAQQYATLLKKYNPASGAFRKAKTDRERKIAVDRFGLLAPEFLKLADTNPKDPIALKALRQAIQAVGSTDSAAMNTWEINRADFPSRNKDKTAGKIVSVILRDHARSDKLGPVIDRMRYAYRMEFAECLHTIERTNPHRNMRALACLALARFLNDRLRMLQLLEDRPDLKKRYAAIFGKDYLQTFRQSEPEKRITELFEKATKYGDVKMPYGGTVGQQARSELYEIRHLSIGKVAPDIVGKDQDGKTFKLSDYRGKVVLLYFWVEF